MKRPQLSIAGMMGLVAIVSLNVVLRRYSMALIPIFSPRLARVHWFLSWPC